MCFSHPETDYMIENLDEVKVIDNNVELHADPFFESLENNLLPDVFRHCFGHRHSTRATACRLLNPHRKVEAVVGSSTTILQLRISMNNLSLNTSKTE